MDRRTFMQQSLAMSAAGLATTLPGCGGGAESDVYGGMRMALTTWSFKNFTGPQAVAMTSEHGITLSELSPMHSMFLGNGEADRSLGLYHENPVTWAKMNAAYEQYNIKPVGYGVVAFDTDEHKSRTVFEWARANGIETISADPSPDSFDMLDKLVEEYSVKIGIHNHGPEDVKYGKISQCVEALKDHHPDVGMCVDTGHFFRAGEDPVEALETFGDRVHGCHIKDVIAGAPPKKERAVWGDGDMDLPAILKAIKRIGFTGPVALEYEDNWDNPQPHITRSLENLRQMIKEVL